MQNRNSRNLGQTSLTGRRRHTHPMKTYDTLPAPLRQWLAQAALPWSPASARRIWSRARQRGLEVEDVLRTLTQAETRTLARDKHALGNITHQR
ncbi:DUF6525 family protein [Sulfitobacter sp.]|uniref:DUF6525 family protein n=1 Tax=Sulfitobacter sp. TaxID=1903071 RepID=UPI00329A6800